MLFQNNPEELPLYFFERISQIPRESGSEKGISDFLKGWAEGLGLWCVQDEGWNLIIKKPGSPGCVSLPPVILQAHIDMVCEKTPDSAHDFAVDSIPLKLDGDWLSSAAGTTLGADDGIGVALCMAALSSEELVHPPLEVLFTVQEESTFYGAEHVRWDLLEGRRLINLDHAVECEVLTGSCGGSGVEVALPVERQEIAAGAACYALTLTGLPGGHSGEDIHRGHGSAIQLMTRVLLRLRSKFDASLISLEGGASRLAISRDAHAVVCASAGIAELRGELQRLEAEFRREYQAVAPGLSLSLSKGPEQAACLTRQSLDRVLTGLALFPDGIQNMNGAFPGRVESSVNLGVLKTEASQFIMTAEIRGGYLSTVESIREKISVLSDALGGACRFFAGYLPWESRGDSPLRAAAVRTYRALFGAEMKAIVVHAGIECGCFLRQVPELDAISIGPDCESFHSPQERMSVSSAKRVWRLLKELLKNLAGEAGC